MNQTQPHNNLSPEDVMRVVVDGVRAMFAGHNPDKKLKELRRQLGNAAKNLNIEPDEIRRLFDKILNEEKKMEKYEPIMIGPSNWMGGVQQAAGQIPQSIVIGGQVFSIEFSLGCCWLRTEFSDDHGREDWIGKNTEECLFIISDKIVFGKGIKYENGAIPINSVSYSVGLGVDIFLNPKTQDIEVAILHASLCQRALDVVEKVKISKRAKDAICFGFLENMASRIEALKAAQKEGATHITGEIEKPFLPYGLTSLPEWKEGENK